MIIDKIANEFFELLYNRLDCDWNSDDCTYITLIADKKNKGTIDSEEDLKQLIIDNIGSELKIKSCYQVYLSCGSSQKDLQQLKEYYHKKVNHINTYIDRFNHKSKYWEINIRTTGIYDDGGWQFLVIPTYKLTYEWIKELNKQYIGDDIMKTNTLIARKRIYKNNPIHIHDRILVSDETETIHNVDESKNLINVPKADFLFSELNKFSTHNEEDDDYCDTYKGINKIEAIELVNGDLHITSKTECNSRTGWEICGILLDRVIMFSIYTDDNRVIRFDFQGMIDNDKGYQATYFQKITDESQNSLSEAKTKELIKQIQSEEDKIIELSASSLYENPKNNFSKESGLVPNGDFPYMVEFFSFDLIDDEFESDYQGCFGINSEYIKDAYKLIQQIEKRAEELERKYADKGVKVTVNGFNDGCEKGMAIYVWIPYQ